jgi:hypothetical protein
MARPRKPIDEDQVERLASLHCTTQEIATVFDCSTDTIERRFAATLAKGRAEGKISLRRAQFRAALKGNVTMQIWLGKQLLGQKEPESDSASKPSADSLEQARQVRAAVRAMEAADGVAGGVAAA